MKKLKFLFICFAMMILLALTNYNPGMKVVFAADTTNIALMKVATADSWQAIYGNNPDKGNDSSLSTKWCANDGAWGHWWKVDLDGFYSITGSEVTWEKDNKIYKYKIEVSSDDKNWTTVINKTDNTNKNQIQKDDFVIDNVKFVKITVTETESGIWASFYDFKVFGKEALGEPYVSNTFTPSNTERKNMNFNTDWLYSSEDISNGMDITLNESRFTKVNIPHANKILTTRENIDSSQFQFISWYRRHFSLPLDYKNSRVIVEFEGVGTFSQIYVNGKFVTDHKGAYTSFKVDITDYINFGDADNVIAVKVDSTERKDIPPENFLVDYYLFGGIARDVNLIITNPLYVDRTYLVTSPIDYNNTKSVVVLTKTNVINTSDSLVNCKVKTNIVDKDNNLVAIAETVGDVPANGSYEFNSQTTRIVNPDLWHPDSSYMYKAYTQVIYNDENVDEYITPIGLRWIEFSSKDGKFYINNQYLKLRGLDRHETFPYIGRAAANRLQRKDADILKYDLGCNMIRCSHYVQDPEFLNRCDEIGLLVLEEAPSWGNIGMSDWKEVFINNIKEMILRDRNHPSIVTWGVRVNESIDDNTFYKKTNEVARGLDPSRATTGSRFTSNYLSTFLEDLFGFNDFTGGIKAPRVLPWLVTEYEGHIFPIRSFDEESRLLQNFTRHASVQNESYGRSDVSGALGWCAFDYNTPISDSVSSNNIRYHGTYDLFRNPKPVAAFYKSQNNRDLYGSMVYIANYWTPNVPSNITVASNCDEVEIFVNGVSKGIKKPNTYMNLPYPLTVFDNIIYETGNIRAEGRVNGNVVTTFTRYTPGTPKNIILKADDTSIVADGSDTTRVYVAVVDENNQVVPYADNNIKFTVNGSCTLIGENPFKLEAGQGAIFIQSKLDDLGQITINAESNGLISSDITIDTTELKESRVPCNYSYKTIDPQPGDNLALNKFATSDSEQLGKGNGSYKANDGNLSSRWCANNSNADHWWKVDLGDIYPIDGVEINWEYAELYNYVLEVSIDNNNWIKVIDKSTNDSNEKSQMSGFSKENARYVRITVTGLKSGYWASMNECKVFYAK
ncbi:hypothetical protein UT300007_28490 [Clostridium sp. CTA-7]